MGEPVQQVAQQANSESSLGAFVSKFFNLLNEKHVTWAVLRGSDQLPDRVRYDIDILLAPQHLADAESIIEETIREAGWKRVALINKFHYRCHILVGPEPERRFLPIDLFTGCDHRFYPLANADTALANRRMVAPGIWQVPPGFGAVIALLKELMRHDTFKENSRAEVREGALSDAEGFVRTGEESLGVSLAERLCGACQMNDWTTVEACAPEIRKRIQRRCLGLLPAALGFFTKNLIHHFRPTLSMFVVLLGPDGSGKSTVATELCQGLRQRPFKVCKHFEYNFRILPEMKTYASFLRGLFGEPGKRERIEPPTPGTRGSGMNKDHPPFRALIYIAYYSLDLILGHLYVRKLRGQSALIIFARYFQDYYYQKGYGRAPRFCVSLIEKLVPQPDLILYLDRDANDIYAGKPELDIEEIQRQQVIIRKLVKTRPGAVSIDASRGVDATVEQIRQLILDSVLFGLT